MDEEDIKLCGVSSKVLGLKVLKYEKISKEIIDNRKLKEDDLLVIALLNKHKIR